MQKFRNLPKQVKQRAKQIGVGITGALVSLSASATPTNDWPATLDGAVAYMEAKGAIALGVAAVVTLIVLGLKGAKLPRRA